MAILLSEKSCKYNRKQIVGVNRRKFNSAFLGPRGRYRVVTMPLAGRYQANIPHPRTRPKVLRVVLGPYVQYCPCEASEQKLGRKPKSELKGIIELSYCHHRFVFKKQAFRKKERQNWMKNDQVNVHVAKVASGLFCAN